MNVIAIALALFVRVLVPLTLLLTIGEWIKRRDKNYWLKT